MSLTQAFATVMTLQRRQWWSAIEEHSQRADSDFHGRVSEFHWAGPMMRLGGQPLYRSMAEQFASGQMLHLHNKLRGHRLTSGRD